MATSPADNTAVVWFRRDLRVDDNPALNAALAANVRVVPTFIWSPEEEGQFQPGRCCRWWTKCSVLDFQNQLSVLGSQLILRRNTDSTAALIKLCKETGASTVYFNNLYDPISLMKDHDVKRALSEAGITAHSFNGDMLYEPWEVLDEEKQAFSTFAGFWERTISMPYPPPFPLAAPTAMPPVQPGLDSVPHADMDWFMTPEQAASSEQLKYKWKVGVQGAIEMLETFLSNQLGVFAHDRAKVDRDSTSRLSPWIRTGTISVRYIYYRVRQCQAQWLAQGEDHTASCSDFLQQMGYREYGRYLSFHFPFIHERALLSHLRACPWRIDQQAFKAWRQGQTGYPLVDAAMRQLWSTGWCHNRLRVVASSFLVKDLLLPWQWGLKHFWDAQIDADLECDSLGWQYVSGGLADAHPFSYMINIEVESARFDADGEFVRRWLPVLSRLPSRYIHAPWTAPPEVLLAADVELGGNYPMPIITAEEAQTNVEFACSVLEKCSVDAITPGGTKHPYRQATDPGHASYSGPEVGGGNHLGSSAPMEAANVSGSGSGNPSGPGSDNAGMRVHYQFPPKLPPKPASQPGDDIQMRQQATQDILDGILLRQRQLRALGGHMQGSGTGAPQQLGSGRRRSQDNMETVREQGDGEEEGQGEIDGHVPYGGRKRYWDDEDSDEASDESDAVSEEVVSNAINATSMFTGQSCMPRQRRRPAQSQQPQVSQHTMAASNMTQPEPHWATDLEHQPAISEVGEPHGNPGHFLSADPSSMGGAAGQQRSGGVHIAGAAVKAAQQARGLRKAEQQWLDGVEAPEGFQDHDGDGDDGDEQMEDVSEEEEEGNESPLEAKSMRQAAAPHLHMTGQEELGQAVAAAKRYKVSEEQ